MLTDLSVRTVDPKARQKFLSKEADVYLVHWQALRLMPELTNRQWFHVIADEVHKAKNRNAKQTKALKRIKTKYRTGLSGTPLVNRPDELWSILNWLYPKEFKSFWRFYKRHVDFEIIYPHGYHQINGPKNVDELHQTLKPFFVRRLKRDVLVNLPDKYYTTINVDLHPTQRRSYNEMRKDMIAWVGENLDQPLVAPVVIAQLQRLQQFALASVHIDEGQNISLHEPSSKLDAMMDILEDLGEEQLVVFSQFAKMTTLTMERLKKSGVKAVEYTGQVSTDQRETNRELFQNGDAQVFVGTIGAGGTGIDLYNASRVLFLDRDWSPANNQQAEDRLHREGQKNAVQVIDLIANDTVDLGRHQRIEQKWQWVREILGDT